MSIAVRAFARHGLVTMRIPTHSIYLEPHEMEFVNKSAL